MLQRITDEQKVTAHWLASSCLFCSLDVLIFLICDALLHCFVCPAHSVLLKAIHSYENHYMVKGAFLYCVAAVVKHVLEAMLLVLSQGKHSSHLV